MSVRARRCEIVYVKNPSFNLSHDKKLMEFFDNQCPGWDIGFDLGVVEVPVEVLKKVLEPDRDLNLDEIDKELLQEDVDWAKENDEEFVKYYCF